MVVGAIGSRTEIAIIGAGPGGYVAALRAADAGFEVTLIERNLAGGTCLNVGCIPSKTLIELAELRHRAVNAGALGFTTDVTVDMPTLTSHLNDVSAGLRTGVERLLDAAGVTVVRGTANFARYDRLSIDSGDSVSHLDFEHAIVATGARPVALPGVPFDDAFVLDSTGALALEQLPRRLVIVGAGYIGVELGTAFAKLGSDVTLVDAAESILPETPQRLRAPVERALDDLGVTVKLGARVVTTTQGGVALDNGMVLAADRVVVAIGRRSNGDRCGIDTIGGVVDDDGTLRVDAELRVAPNVYAIGDVIPGPALAHRASNDAERVVAAIGGQPIPPPAVVPAVIFSHPEIVMVGEPIGDADTSGLTISQFPHAASARAHTLGSTAGATWLVTDAAGTIVGIHIVGPHASELAGEAALAVEMAATIDDLRLTMHPHPTLSESLAEAAWIAHGAPLHVRR